MSKIDAIDINDLVVFLQKLDKAIVDKSTKIVITDVGTANIIRKFANDVEAVIDDGSTTGVNFEGYCDECGTIDLQWTLPKLWLCDDCQDKHDTTPQDEHDKIVREGLKR